MNDSELDRLLHQWRDSVLADTLITDPAAQPDTPSPRFHRFGRRPIALIAAAVVVLGAAPTYVALRPTGEGPAVSAAPSDAMVSSSTPASTAPSIPGDAGSRSALLAGLVTAGAADWGPVATPEELATRADVVLVGTVVRTLTSGGIALVQVHSEPGSQGRGHFEVGDTVGLVLNADLLEDSIYVEQIPAAVPAGTRLVAYASMSQPESPSAQVIANLEAQVGAITTVRPGLPQTLALQIPGDPAIYWPGLSGSQVGDLTETLPGGTLVGPRLDTTQFIDRRWVLTGLSRSEGQASVPIPLSIAPPAWWTVSPEGKLTYDAGCGAGTAEVVPVVNGYRTLRVVSPAPNCGDAEPATSIRTAFTDTFEASSFVVFPPAAHGDLWYLLPNRSSYQPAFTLE